MKKRILSLLIVFCLAAALLPTITATEMHYETIIAPMFQEVGRFNNGYAPVKVDSKWGYINEDGELVVEPKYDWAGIVSEGVAVTLMLGDCEDGFGESAQGYYAHLIDMNGMDKPLYLREDSYPLIIGDFFDEFFWFYPNCEVSNFFANASLWYCNDGIVNVGGITFTAAGERVIVQNEDDYGMGYCDFNQTSPCVDGVIPMQVTEVPTPMCDAMLIDKDGNVLFYSSEFSNMSAPWEGVQMAQIRVAIQSEDGWSEEYDYLWGLIDADMNWLAEPQFIGYLYTTDGALFHDDLMPIQVENGKWGAINSSGALVIEAKYDAMSCFNHGFSRVIQDGKCFYIDTDGSSYSILNCNGSNANIILGSKVSESGLATVYDADTQKAYYVNLNAAHDGVIPAVTGSDTLGIEAYVDSYAADGAPESLAIPSSIVPIQENGLWGFAKLTFSFSKNPFADVPAGSWYEAPILWALSNGITSGTSDTTFSPGNQCLRAHVVTFLWNAEKCPEPATTSSSFTDVPAGAWYEKPVLWAVENGITSGVSASKFGAGDVCSRYQVVYFLWKAAGAPEPKTTVNPFTDVNPGHFFYKAVLWAVENGITSGTSDTTFSPAQPCNRAQVVTFLYKAYT